VTDAERTKANKDDEISPLSGIVYWCSMLIPRE